ncbi:MAG: RDD family protein [Clostridia bacterium]|nr:RDD family protein [Clostridia bacterium]
MNSICPHPWRRFFARVIDHSFYALFSTLFFAIILGRNANLAHSWLDNYIFASFCYIFGAVIEGILLHFFTTTPGKFLFGIRLTYSDGRKLSIIDGTKRALGMWLHAMGLSIPFINFYTAFRCYKLCKQGKSLPYESYYIVYHTKFSNSALIIVAFLLINVLTVNLAEIAPDHLINLPHKGAITRDEFMENYEYVTRFFYNNNNWMFLDAHGQFRTDRYNSKIKVFSENDNVTRVEAATTGWITDIQMVAIAFSGGSPSEISNFMKSDTFTLFSKDRHTVLFTLDRIDEKSYYDEKFTFSSQNVAYNTIYDWQKQTHTLQMERILS